MGLNLSKSVLPCFVNAENSVICYNTLEYEYNSVEQKDINVVHVYYIIYNW